MDIHKNRIWDMELRMVSREWEEIEKKIKRDKKEDYPPPLLRRYSSHEEENFKRKIMENREQRIKKKH